MSLQNVYRKPFWGHMLIRIVCILISMALVASIAGAAEGPVISIWYGSNQAFGQLGEPQRWINILGNVSDPDGVASLSYTLNGGQASALSMGPDYLRLGELGDFNIEIGYWELSDGLNEVTITAVDSLDNQSIEIVTVNYTKGNTWPLNYSLDWGIAGSINDVAQIVDGKWRIEGETVRTVEPGYDRLIAIGDRSWTNYEVTVPVIVHSIADDYLYTPIVGILTRWQGHVANGSQPSDQWWPLGALASYSFGASPSFKMWLKPTDVRVANSSFVFELGTEYIFKLRSETIGNDSLYKFKIWKSSESEPLNWDQIEEELNDDQTTGSILLLAHEVDASFGNVTITSFFTDFSYTPVTPCRIVDTRKAGGAIPPGGIRDYNVRDAVASQGGEPAGCPSPKGEPLAVHVNVTAVPLGNGNIAAYPFGTTAPNASLVNYRADAQNVANSGTLKTCFNCAKDISIKSNFGTAHVVIDVLGYYYAQP